MTITMNIDKKTLAKLCREYGKLARIWRRKFTGLLPIVEAQKLYDDMKFGSTFELAYKLGGLSQDQVKLALSLWKKFEDKPILLSFLLNAEVGLNKLARIASVVTKENEELWATQVKLLPKSALETLIRDVKREQEKLQGDAPTHQMPLQGGSPFSLPDQNSSNNKVSESQVAGQMQMLLGKLSISESENYNGSNKAKNDPNFLPGQKQDKPTKPQIEQITLTIRKLKATPEMVEKLKQKISELEEKGIDITELLLELLKKSEHEIEQEKEQISKEITEAGPAKSRHIPAKVKKILKQEYGTKCSIPGCNKPAKEIHHTQRFALGKTHDPRYLAPLCAEHHIIAQTIDIKFHKIRLAAIT